MVSTRTRLGTAVVLSLCGLLVGSWTARADVTIADGTLGFQIYHPPAALGGTDAVEPSIGADHVTDNIMYQALLQTFRVNFTDDPANPTARATDTWKDVSAPLTSINSLDPILFTDSQLGRTFVSQLTGQDSLSEFTDNDGDSYTPSQGGGIPSGVDHQSIGSGPYNPNGIPPQPTVFGHAVFYCSQDVATAFCARSDNGGISYGAGVPIYSFDQCGGLHGHIRVSPSGIDMVPNQNCDKQMDLGAGANQSLNGGTFPFQAVVTSANNGNTWTVQTIPDSHSTLRSDPSVAADNAGKVYFGYEDSVNDTNGNQIAGRAKIATATVDGSGIFHWSPSVDVGAALGIQNVQFPEVIAGDAGRAAYAFLGSTTPGYPENQGNLGANPPDPGFTGTWDLYVAITLDGGASYQVTDLTPKDPVERGCTFLAGNGSCPSSKRNLFDFMDITVDENGRTLVGYADGCIDACAQGDGSACQGSSPTANPMALCNKGPAASTSRFATIARLQCGPSLYVEYDHQYDCGPTAGQVPEAPWVPALGVVAAAAATVPVIVNRRRRGALGVQ